jgi:DhnA family fructose-bisphosphate aldolase class Ia
VKNRYYKFFREDGKALILAFDHGGGGDIWIDPAHVIKSVKAGGFDGILSTYGVLSKFKKEIGHLGTLLRMEIFGSNMSKSNPMASPISSPFTVEDALYLGADGVMTMGIFGNEMDLQNMQYVASVNAACTKYGLVSASEMLPNGFSSDPNDRTVKAMNIACRLGAELGVDIVKTQFVPPVEDFKKVVDNTYVDVLALGGAKVPDERDVLENAKQALEAGCKGLVIGRNVWAHENITGMATALNMVVHGNKSVDEALKALK